MTILAYQLLAVSGEILTVPTLTGTSFVEHPRHPFIRATGGGNFVEVYALTGDGDSTLLAGELAGSTREAYTEWLTQAFEASPVVYEEQIDAYLDGDEYDHLVPLAYIYETRQSLFIYEHTAPPRTYTRCSPGIITKEKMNLVGVQAPIQILNREPEPGKEPFGQQVPEGTFDEVYAGLRAHLASLDGVEVFYPDGLGIEVRQGRDCVLVVSDDSMEALEAHFYAFEHPALTEQYGDSPDLLRTLEAKEISLPALDV